MDELTAARLARDIERLRTKHYDEGLEDPLLALKGIADRYGVDLEVTIKAFTADPSPSSQVRGQ